MKEYYLGVDVSKGYADFRLLDAQKRPIGKGFRLNDTFVGHQKLIAFLEEIRGKDPDVIIRIGVESTGGYENNWYNFLLDEKKDYIYVARLNPLYVKSFIRSSSKGSVNDKVSARHIAEYLIAHSDTIRYNEVDPYYHLRKKWNYIQLLIKQEVELKNFFLEQLYESFPELVSYCKDSIPNWLIHLLVKYPSYQKIKRAGIRKITQIPYISYQKAEKLFQKINLVQQSIDPIAENTIQSLGQQIFHIQNLITLQKKVLVKEYQKLDAPFKKAVDLVKSLKGVGIYSAIGLVLHIKDINRFPSAKKLVAYFGLNPVYHQSGDYKGKTRISKQGNPRVRAILFMVALSAIQHAPVIKRYYQKLVMRGKNKKAALIACMHKILRIIFGILKHQTPFDPNIDEKYRQKSTPTHNEQNSHCVKITPEDLEAPVSRKEYKKRKEALLSQDSVPVQIRDKKNASFLK